ncbi:MAG: hypothetical protein ACLR8P_02755 [Clostridium fessum]
MDCSCGVVVYMDAAMEKIGREYPDKTVVPAGLFYYHIEDPMVERKPVRVGGGDECRYFEGTADERAGKRRSGGTGTSG